MTPQDRERVNQILMQQAPLNVDEAFLVDLVCRQEAEIERTLINKMNAVQEVQGKYSAERQRKHQALAALRIVLARVRYSDIASDWKAPPFSISGSPTELAIQAQYEGRLEDWLEQTIAELES